jgi:hypothetical protein
MPSNSAVTVLSLIVQCVAQPPVASQTRRHCPATEHSQLPTWQSVSCTSTANVLGGQVHVRRRIPALREISRAAKCRNVGCVRACTAPRRLAHGCPGVCLLHHWHRRAVPLLHPPLPRPVSRRERQHGHTRQTKRDTNRRPHSYQGTHPLRCRRGLFGRCARCQQRRDTTDNYAQAAFESLNGCFFQLRTPTV